VWSEQVRFRWAKTTSIDRLQDLSVVFCNYSVLWVLLSRPPSRKTIAKGDPPPSMAPSSCPGRRQEVQSTC
jgi:hypothetical protein